MFRRIHHVGIAVEHLDEARRRYESMGLACEGVETVESEGVRVAMFPLGESRLELLEPTAPEGVIDKFLATRGEGIHHIAFEVDDIRYAMKALKGQGFRLVDEEPRRGHGGRLVAFVHPKSAGGVLVELVQSR